MPLNRISLFGQILVVGAGIVQSPGVPDAKGMTLLQTFTLRERFGVTHPEQPVEFSYTGGAVITSNTAMFGPTGQEVPFQQLSNGNVLIRTRLPKSAIAQTFRQYGNIDPATDTLRINLGNQGKYPIPGDVIQIQARTLPGGISARTNYFIKNLDRAPGTFQLARSKDLGDTVEISTRGSGNAIITKQGWIIDPDDSTFDTIYSKNHGYQRGDPIKLKTAGRLPVPLQSNTTYYVIRLTADTFQLASTYADAGNGAPIDISALGSGIMETSVEWVWTLMSASAPSVSVSQPVEISDRGTYWEVSNGLTGVRVVKSSANPSPYNKAPIQGVRLADGTWSGGKTNYLYNAYTSSPVDTATGYTLKILESGPLVTRMEAAYSFNRPTYTYGSGHRIISVDPANDTVMVAGNPYYWGGSTSVAFHANGGTLPCGLSENELYWPTSKAYDQSLKQTSFQFTDTKGGKVVDITCSPKGPAYVQETVNLAGPGFFKETITLYAGHKSIVIEDDMDSRVQYFLNLYQANRFVPTQARYRGHGASNMTCGYTLVGGTRSPYAGYTDAFYELSYETPRDSGYLCSSNTIKYAPLWYITNSGRETGWYWMFYDSVASRSAPLVGYYIGRTSRYLGAVFCGPGLYTSPSHFAAGNQPAAGITMHAGFRGPDGRSYQRTRREWALFVGTKEDLSAPSDIQPIGIERNILSGINLTRLASYSLNVSDPIGGWPPPYTSRATYDQFVKRIHTDSAYRSYVYKVSPEIRDLIDMWTGNSAADVEVMVSRIEQLIQHWQHILVNRNGTFDSWWHYYQPGLAWSPKLERLLAVLNSPAATFEQKERAKSAAAFAASVFWDNDYVPWDPDTAEGTGNINQAAQYSNYRAKNALVLFTQAFMAEKQASASQYAQGVYQYYLNPLSGAPRGSTHYHAAAIDPTLTNFIELKNRGVDIKTYPLWKKYGRWMLNALTPPEPRFGMGRKMVSLGDGNTEATPSHGVLATLFRFADPDSSKQMQWGWTAQNTSTRKAHGQFSAASFLVIDENAPAQIPQLRSEHFPGYWSVMRHGFQTPNETVLWFANGDWYSDHRHADSGQVSIYTLAAPLAIDWNPNLYYPHVAGAYQHNRVVRESEIGQAWNADNAALSSGENWGLASQTEFSSFIHSSNATTAFTSKDGTVWNRTVRTVAPNLRYPVILVQDAFTGRESKTSKVLTWNLMADGNVETPAGPYTPIQRVNTGGTATPNAYPSTGSAYSLGSGLQKFSFTGQSWLAHPTHGIDWELYLLPDGNQKFLIGNWGHTMHSNREMSEYQTTNGAPFREQQHILRVQGTGSFTTLILPYRKREAAIRSVTESSCGIQVVQGAEALCFDNSSYSYEDGTKKMLTTFDNTSASFAGISVTGGPTEVTTTPTQVTITAHGSKGLRTLTLPGRWTAMEPITKNGTYYVWDYQSDVPLSLTLPLRRLPAPQLRVKQ